LSDERLLTLDHLNQNLTCI